MPQEARPIHPTTTSAVFPLLKLPHELLNLVLENFNPCPTHLGRLTSTYVSDQSTLASLCRVHAVIRPFAERILYRAYNKPENVFCSSEKRYNVHPNRSLRSLLHTLCVRPDLGKHIKHVTLGAWETCASLRSILHDNKPLELVAGNLQHEQIFRSRTNTPLASDHPEWADRLANGMEDAEITSLLLHSPNIQSVIVHLPRAMANVDGYCCLPAALGFLSRSPAYHGLRQLKAVHVFSNLDRCRDILPTEALFPRQAHYASLLQLPALTSFVAEGDYTRRFDNPSALETLLPSTLTVKKIMLRKSHPALSELTALINSCIRLEEFELDMHCQESARHDLHITWPKLLTALRPAKDTLQKLTLATIRRCWLEVGASYLTTDQTVHWRPLSSLRDFTALRALTVQQTALLGSTIYDFKWTESDPWFKAPTLLSQLPGGLDKLTIEDATSMSVYALADFEREPPTSNTSINTLKKVCLIPLSAEDLLHFIKGAGDAEAIPELTARELDMRLAHIMNLSELLAKKGVKFVLGAEEYKVGWESASLFHNGNQCTLRLCRC